MSTKPKQPTNPTLITAQALERIVEVIVGTDDTYGVTQALDAVAHATPSSPPCRRATAPASMTACWLS
jgi:hypothetical protein